MAAGDKHTTNDGKYTFTEKENIEPIEPGFENATIDANEYNKNMLAFIDMYNYSAQSEDISFDVPTLKPFNG